MTGPRGPHQEVMTRLIVERGGGLFMVYRESERMFRRNEAQRKRERHRVPAEGVDRECSLADLLQDGEYMIFDLSGSV